MSISISSFYGKKKTVPVKVVDVPSDSDIGESDGDDFEDLYDAGSDSDSSSSESDYDLAKPSTSRASKTPPATNNAVLDKPGPSTNRATVTSVTPLPARNKNL